MKHRPCGVVVFFLCFTLPASLLSQGSWGVQLGGVSSQISGDGYRGFKKFGIETGLNYMSPLGSNGNAWGFELNYIQKGALERQEITEGNFNVYRYSAHYIDLPLSYFFPLWGVYVQTGVSASFNLKTEISTNDLLAPPLANQRLIELGFVGAVLFEISKRLSFSVRYYNSLLPVQRSNAIAAYYWFSQGGMHAVLGARLQYQFQLPPFRWDKPKGSSAEVKID